MNVLFEDKQFEEEIRKSINKYNGDITIEDLRDITKLQIINYSDKPPIRNLQGIQYLSKLEKLELMGFEIRDISLISNLKNLQYLDLSDNNIKNISYISNLKKLSHLNLT